MTEATGTPRRPCAYCRQPTVVTKEQGLQNTLLARYPHSPVRVRYPPICLATQQGLRAMVVAEQDADS